MSKPKIKLGVLKSEHAPVEINKPESEPETDPDFYSLKKLNEYIKEIVENNVFFMFMELLKKIGQDYGDKGISYDELKDKYLTYFKKNLKNSNLYCDILSLNLDNIDINHLGESPQTKDNIRKSDSPIARDSDKETDCIETEAGGCVINESKCYARTATNTQCSRKKQKDSDFCGSHSHSQPYGRIDQPCTVDTRPKKRGRPPISQQTTKKTEPVESNLLQIEATIENIGGIEYIVDNNTNKIYKMTNGSSIEEDEINIDNLKLIGQKLPNKQVVWYTDTDLMFVNK
jgi:hypothetical protein